MTDRRSHPRSTAERRHVEPDRLGLRLPVLVAALAVSVYLTTSPVAQLEEPSLYKGQVAGSSPAGATIWGVTKQGAAYVVARNLPCKPACAKPLVTEFTLKLAAPNTVI